MKNFRLNEETLRNIQAGTGLNPSFIACSDLSDVERNIEKRIGCQLKPSVTIGGMSPRGSVYLMFNRILTSLQIDRVLASIKP